MEVFRTKQFYIFVRETHSLWWDRETGILIPKAVWELTEAEDPICQGICEGLIGKVEHSMFEPKLLIIRESEPVGLLQENDIVHKIKSVVFIPLGPENVNLNLNSCPKHRNYCDKPISNTTSLFDVPLPKSSALTKTWGTLKNAGSSIKNTTQQAAAIASGFPKRKDKSKFERQIVEEFYKIFNDTSSFYFCRTYDITNSLQRLCDVKKTAEIHWRNADDRFFWNKHMLKELVDSNNPLFDHWIMPIIQGYIQIEECTIQLDNDIQGVAVTPKFETFKLCLISRRSRFRAGTRYNRRGVDEHGHCANYVETEQILLYQHHQASFVQVRGSVPVYWSQPGYKYRPPPRIDKGEEETKAAFSKHFDEEIMTYGPVSIVNLVEQTGKERVIWEAYTTNIIDYNSPDITYVTFDFHEYCSGMRFENVSILIDTINELIKNMNYCWKDKQGLICTQNGIFRVNCIDCLDRTNVVQTAIAKNVLEIQFCKLGLISPERMMPDNVKNKFQVLWANNGDIISKQYAGTNALKGDYTRTGERKFTGIMKDGMNSANRYYLSRFKDSTRQGTIDLMLGNSVTEELFKESKVDEEDCTVTAEHVKLLIEDCKKLLINSPETVLGSWGLINADPHIGDPSETEMDTILILTKDSYFVADYDDEVDRITKYQRVLLKDITYLECGIPESGTSFFKSQPIKHCIRLNYKVNETHGYFHMFRSTNLRFFNNMAVVIRNEEEEVESLKAICEAFVVALDICGLPAVPYKSGNKLEKRKSKIVGTDHPSSNVYFDIVGLPQLTRNVSESQLLSLKNVGTKALSNMSQQFAKLNKIGSKIRRNPTQTTTTPTEISSDSEDDTENSIFQTDSTTHSTDSFLPSVGIVMSATDDADKKSNPEIHLQACDDQSTPSNVTTKLSHSYDQVDVTTDKQRSSSQSNLPSLNISQSQSESALKLHFASPVTNVTKVLSPLTKLAKGVQHLGANLDPRRLSGGVRQVERDSEEVKKLQRVKIEFIEVGKPARALDTLQEVFRNKKWAYNWSESVLEPIMFKYLDLCVELKKSHIAKEGLFQYRNMFQSVNVGSLENVIRVYLRMAEEKTENAREQSAQAVVDIDDLDNLATPESILLSAVSGEDAQDRSDRTILTPWVKFLWESYCQCLELLRTNAHVETLYHDIARMAFQFCLKYNRKTEFRKLCDKLRKHLEDICKLPVQVANVSISKPETQQLNLETRLHQLDYAIQMELWQEAYKAIEDIHGLMNMSKKMPVPKTMANYYQKLAMVFWKAGNYLFHAAALFKLFQLSKEMKKNITQEELQRMACQVLIATLSIPLPSAHPEFDRFIETDKSPMEKAQRLAVLLGLFQPPTRASLLKDIVRVNVVSLATPQLQNLYNWLEVDFHPLLLCSRVQSVIESLQAEENVRLQQYINALQDVTLVRLVRQIAQVYQTVQFSRLLELALFTTPFHLERLLVDCVRHNDMQIRIDHGKECIHFGMDLSESQREDKSEGPTLQSMPSEQVRNQLVHMATVLHQAINVINPNKKKLERESQRAAMVANYHETKVREHQKILQRHKIIEDRKEYIERLNTVREEEEQRRLEELARQHFLAEQKRLEQEREERERKRALNEIQQIKNRHLKEKIQQIQQTPHGNKVLAKIDISGLNADEIAAKEAEELQKGRRELQAKLKSQEKKVDYFERAKRLEEIPLLQESMKERQLQDQAFWEQQERERIAAAVEERRLAVATRDRLARMKPEKDAFLEKLMKERNIVYEDKLREFEKRLAEERRKRLAERKAQRKEERRLRYLKEKEEEEERKREEERRREEEERLRREEQERKEREERERQRQEELERKERERQEMLERAAAKQRQKEEEVERKLMEDASAAAPSSWRGGDEAPKKVEAWKPMRFREADAKPPTESKADSTWRYERREEKSIRFERNDDRRGEDKPRRDDSRDRREDSGRGRDERGERNYYRSGGDDGGSYRREDKEERGRRDVDRREITRGSYGYERDRYEDKERDRDRYARREDKDRTWRSAPKADEDRPRRSGTERSGAPSRGSRDAPSDWRSGGGPRRGDDERDRSRRDDKKDDRRGGGGEERRTAAPVREKPREQTEEDGWSQVPAGRRR